MYEFRRNIKTSQRFEYGIYQILDHFFGRERVFRWLGKRRQKFYKNLHATLKASGEGKITPIERRTNLSVEEFQKHYVRKGIPVILEGAAKDWDCANKWSLEYFKELHGKDEILLVNQEQVGFPHEKTTLGDVIDNIRSGGKKYYRFYPLLDKHPEHIKDFDYKWLLERSGKMKFFESFQVFIGGKDSVTSFHNAASSNLFVQTYGEKTWVIYSHYYSMIFDPDPVRNIYRHGPHKTEKGPYDPFNPNFDYPYTLFKYIDGYEVKLKPGDVLWNPPFYWHAVHNPTDAIGVGYRWFAPLNALKVAPLYMCLDLFARNPPIWKGYKLANKDFNLVNLAETGKLDDFLKERKENTAKKP